MSITVERYGRYQLPFRGRHFLFQRSLTTRSFIIRVSSSGVTVTCHVASARRCMLFTDAALV